MGKTKQKDSSKGTAPEKALIDVARETTSAVREREAKEREQKEAREKKEEEEFVLKRIPEVLAEAKEEIKKAAKEGRNHAYVPIYRFLDDTPSWGYKISKSVKEKLEKEGFTVQDKNEVMEPFGSDPMFDTTVYSKFLEIYW